VKFNIGQALIFTTRDYKIGKARAHKSV